MDGLLHTMKSRSDLVVFLDYDGTLAEIVADPATAVISADLQATLLKLTRLFPVAIVTGRKESTIRGFLGDVANHVILATSHGLEICFPDDTPRLSVGIHFRTALEHVQRLVATALSSLPPGVAVEDNWLSVSVHYRQVQAIADIAKLEDFVDSLVPLFPSLRKTVGKCVFEFRPQCDWHKGRAVDHVLKRLAEKSAPFAVYFGDDVTDEDAFAVVNEAGGLSIQIGNHKTHTQAQCLLDAPADVARLLTLITSGLWLSCVKADYVCVTRGVSVCD